MKEGQKEMLVLQLQSLKGKIGEEKKREKRKEKGLFKKRV